VVGGGMITADLILPSLYQLQRREIIERSTVCALARPRFEPWRTTRRSAERFRAAPFTAQPALATPRRSSKHPDLFGELIDRMAPRRS